MILNIHTRVRSYQRSSSTVFADWIVGEAHTGGHRLIYWVLWSGHDR